MISSVISEFGSSVAEGDESIIHLIKFYDYNLYNENARLAQEIFEIEMKLREALSVIFIDTFQDDFYTFLQDIDVAPQDPPQESQMQSRYENQFFYLLFSDYIKLNTRKSVKQVPQLIQFLRDSADFQEFREYFVHAPISNEKFADFMQSLKSVLESIEKVRNCVMHNRVVPENDKDNYIQAKEKLMTQVGEFLGSLA